MARNVVFGARCYETYFVVVVVAITVQTAFLVTRKSCQTRLEDATSAGKAGKDRLKVVAGRSLVTGKRSCISSEHFRCSA